MVRRFKTRPVEVDAMQFDGYNYNALRDWTDNQFDLTEEEGFGGLVYDKLHDTWINVARGQWIVKGAKGEFYPCDDETFHWKYEEVTNVLPEVQQD